MVYFYNLAYLLLLFQNQSHHNHTGLKELFLKDSNGVYQKVNPKDINYLEANGKNIAIHISSITMKIYHNFKIFSNASLYFLPTGILQCPRFIILVDLSYEMSFFLLIIYFLWHLIKYTGSICNILVTE